MIRLAQQLSLGMSTLQATYFLKSIGGIYNFKSTLAQLLKKQLIIDKTPKIVCIDDFALKKRYIVTASL